MQAPQIASIAEPNLTFGPRLLRHFVPAEWRINMVEYKKVMSGILTAAMMVASMVCLPKNVQAAESATPTELVYNQPVNDSFSYAGEVKTYTFNLSESMARSTFGWKVCVKNVSDDADIKLKVNKSDKDYTSDKLGKGGNETCVNMIGTTCASGEYTVTVENKTGSTGSNAAFTITYQIGYKGGSVAIGDLIRFTNNSNYTTTVAMRKAYSITKTTRGEALPDGAILVGVRANLDKRACNNTCSEPTMKMTLSDETEIKLNNVSYTEIKNSKEPMYQPLLRVDFVAKNVTTGTSTYDFNAVLDYIYPYD